MKPSISIKNLTVSYDHKRVLSNIFLDIYPGKIYGVIGPNGAGKSTLFKAILQLIPYNSGEITLLENDLQGIKKKLAYIPQKDDVDWTFPASVMDIVLMGRYPHKKRFESMNKYDIDLACHTMSLLGIDHLKDRQIGNLSGGQQQRVFIARAMCQESDIFLFDEPFVGIDQTTEEKIIDILQKLASSQKTLLVIHHDLSTVPEYYQEVIMINQRLIVAGPTDQVFTTDNINATFRGQLNILHETKSSQ